MASSLTPAERSLRGSIASYESWAKTSDRAARTAPARNAQRQKFEDQVDPDGLLDPVERAKRGDFAYRAHMKRLALASAKARRIKAEAS